MSRLTRRIIFYIFVLLFLIAAPAVVLFTEGYRLDFQTGRLEQLGVLVIKSKPENAEIAINNKPTKEQTAAIIKLIPDDYRIRVEKDGFHSWTKMLGVRSRQTTFIEDVVLWKDAASSLIFETNPKTIAFSPNLDFVLLINEVGNLVFYDTILGTETVIAGFPGQTPLEARLLTGQEGEPKIQLSPDSSVALVRFGQKVFMVTLTRPLERQVPRRLDAFGFNGLTWTPTAASLAGERNGFLYTLNLFTNQTRRITKSGPVFLFQGADVWSIAQTGDALLRSQAGDLTTEPAIALTLPQDNYSFLSLDAPYLLIHAENAGRLYLIDPQNPGQPLVDLPGANAKMRWNRDGELELLAWNEFEIWRANTARGVVELLRRQSEPIVTADWYPLGEYILFATEKTIAALELDDRDERNVTNLVSIDNGQIKNFAITASGKKLYFGVSETESGVYSLELQ